MSTPKVKKSASEAYSHEAHADGLWEISKSKGCWFALHSGGKYPAQTARKLSQIADLIQRAIERKTP